VTVRGRDESLLVVEVVVSRRKHTDGGTLFALELLGREVTGCHNPVSLLVMRVLALLMQ
jgi:hypothetical protein